jgi:hypothetical protein
MELIGIMGVMKKNGCQHGKNYLVAENRDAVGGVAGVSVRTPYGSHVMCVNTSRKSYLFKYIFRPKYIQELSSHILVHILNSLFSN